jgi:hypothetical protein
MLKPAPKFVPPTCTKGIRQQTANCPSRRLSYQSHCSRRVFYGFADLRISHALFRLRTSLDLRSNARHAGSTAGEHCATGVPWLWMCGFRCANSCEMLFSGPPCFSSRSDRGFTVGQDGMAGWINRMERRPGARLAVGERKLQVERVESLRS